MNQGTPQPGRQGLPQGRRPRPGQGAPRAPMGNPNGMNGMNGENGGPMPPQRSSGDGKTWTIAIILTVLLVGGAIFLMMRNTSQQDDADNSAKLPTAFAHVMNGNFDEPTVKESGIMEGVSDEDKALIQEAAKVTYTTAWQGRLPELLTEAGQIEKHMTRINHSPTAQEKFFKESFPLLIELQDEVSRATSRTGKSDREFVVKYFDASNHLRVCKDAFEALGTSGDTSLVNDFHVLIAEVINNLDEKTTRTYTDMLRDINLALALTDLKEGKGDAAEVKSFNFGFAMFKALRNDVKKYAAIEKSSAFEAKDLAAALESLKQPSGPGGKNFDDLVAHWTTEMETALKQIDANLRETVKKDLDENVAARKEILNKTRDEIIAYLAVKDKALEAIRRIGQTHDLNGKESVAPLYQRLQDKIDAAKKAQLKVRDELGRE